MTEFLVYKPSFDQINVSFDDVLDMLRVEDRTTDNPVYCEAKQVYSSLPDICETRGGYVIFNSPKIDINEGIISFGEKIIEPQRKVCGYMKNAGYIAVFICSAGEKFTALTRKYNSDGDYLKGYIVDVFGSLIAEKTADFLQRTLQKKVEAKGLHITNRYSPGYCNWNLSGQKKLFELLPSNACDITLTDSMLMIPIKSVSGIIGIGKTVKKQEYACAVCSDKDCPYRNILSNKH